MDILILGNGFDLAHGLKTRYTDFLNYCVNQLNRPNVYIPSDPFFTNMWIRHFLNVQQQLGNTWIDLEKEIYNVIKHISNFSFMNSQNCHKSFFIKFQDMSFNFYKFDKYISNYSMEYRVLNREYYRLDEHNWINYHICFSSARGIINFLYDQLRDFTKQFNKYLLEQVLPIISNSQYKFGLSLLDKKIRILSFNYTDTFERLYNPINVHSKHKYIYVHGKVCDSKDCDLILGTHSFYNHLPNDLNEEINVEFNVFKKHNQRHRYGTIESYQNLLKELNNRLIMINPTFHVIGHSLDKSDHNILRHIFRVTENSTINIYYHNQEALERLINNITEIIGEEDVMTRVKFIHQEDSKHGILIPKQ